MPMLPKNYLKTHENKYLRMIAEARELDKAKNAFIAPRSYPSWTLVEDTCQWTAPTALPDDDKIYKWDEDTTNWVEVT